MGVKLIDLPEGERLQDIARVVNQDDDEAAEAAPPESPAPGA